MQIFLKNILVILLFIITFYFAANVMASSIGRVVKMYMEAKQKVEAVVVRN